MEQRLTWPSSINAQQAADKAFAKSREAAAARKARKKQAQADLRPSPQRFRQFQAAAREVGLSLTMSTIGKAGQHWMFNDAAGQRVLNYWPKTKRGQQTGAKGFIVGGPTEALAFALNVTKLRQHEVVSHAATPPKTVPGWNGFPTANGGHVERVLSAVLTDSRFRESLCSGSANQI